MQVKPTCAPRDSGIMEGSRRADPSPAVLDSAHLPTRRGRTFRGNQPTFNAFSSIVPNGLREHAAPRGLFPAFLIDSIEGAQ